MSDNGPFQTEREAITAVRDILDLPPGTGAWREANLAMLLDTCADAGVEVGAYDSAVLHWLAQYEPQNVAVVAGLIARPRTLTRDRLIAALQHPAVTGALAMLGSQGGTPADLADAILEALDA